MKNAPPHISFAVLALLFVSCGFNLYNPTDKGAPGGLDAEGLRLEGDRLLRDGDHAGAADMYRQAIDADPNLGYARLGRAKAAFDQWGFSQTRLLELFSRDSSSQDAMPFQTVVAIFNDWELTTLDSLYAPAHVAVDYTDGVLNPMFSSGFAASDGFDTAWIAADFSLLLGFHAFISLLDFDDNGRITQDDLPFQDLNLVITEDTVIIEGLDALLADPAYRQAWENNANESLAEADIAANVFLGTFGDSSQTYDEVDTLMMHLQETLAPQ
ncbi:MAG: hypothetical protein GF418_04190 [Chitinivibrionales bacterium]|nr:hypothetical protein [Chitinivibrionales bacterium]MBD3394807.1 hypothetical protein [Chitinivibrionales bacterium]